MENILHEVEGQRNLGHLLCGLVFVIRNPVFFDIVGMTLIILSNH